MVGLIGETLPSAIATPSKPLLSSFFLGGFECSTHVRRDGRRLDLIHSTQHDRWVREDYLRLHEVGIRSARDGIRWHLVERRPGFYDWSSAIPMVRAAASTGTQVIWDLLHFVWPGWVDPCAAECVDRFAHFAGEFPRLLGPESDEPPCLSPIN